MMVISQLRFRKYLDRDNCTSPVDVATVARLPNWQSLPAQLAKGECDVLVIHRRQGIIVGEIKSTGRGDYFKSQLENQQNQIIVKKVQKAVKQLNNQETALRLYLVSDLNVTITMMLITPSLTSAQLLRALTNTPVAQVSVSVSVSLCTLFHQYTAFIHGDTGGYVDVGVGTQYFISTVHTHQLTNVHVARTLSNQQATIHQRCR